MLIIKFILLFFLMCFLYVGCVYYLFFICILTFINKVNYILSMMRYNVFFKFFFSTIYTLITPYHLFEFKNLS